MRDAQPAADVLRVPQQLQQLGHRILGPGELDQLHLVELVPALDAAHVPAGAHLLPPEAGRVRHVADRQPVAIQDLFPVEVGHRRLGGRDPPEVLLRVVVEVVAELGQVACAHQHFRLDHVRRVDLGVAVLRRVQVEHPGDQRPLQPRARAFEHVEARAAELDPPLEVDDVQRSPQVPMRQRLEVERSQRPFLAHHHVLALVPTHRHAGMRQVGDAQHGVPEVDLHPAQLLIQAGDLLPDLRHARLERLPLRALPCPHQLADLLRAGVALGPQRLHLGQDRPPALVQRQRLGHRRVFGPQADHGGQHLLPVFPHELYV